MEQTNTNTILITGASGMMGYHLLEYYKNKNETEVVAIDILPADGVTYLDVRDQKAFSELIVQHLPIKIFHLAAQSLPTLSWEQPRETMDTNAGGTIALFEPIIEAKKQFPLYNPLVIMACSSAEYGQSLIDIKEPITEEAPLLPLHPYGVSKVAQDLLSFQYWKNYGIQTIRVRIFNTTGPRKTNDAVSDFTQRALDVVDGKADTIRVGNLLSKRAINDVRDTIGALILLSEKGTIGEVYNVSGSHIYQMQEIISLLEKVFNRTFETTVDPALIRPTDEPIIVGNSDKLKKDTNWVQEIELEKTIRDMLEYMKKQSD